jgi:hypothetical protein
MVGIIYPVKAPNIQHHETIFYTLYGCSFYGYIHLSNRVFPTATFTIETLIGTVYGLREKKSPFKFNNSIFRILGLIPLVLPSECQNWYKYKVEINASNWPFAYLHFGGLLALYYLLIIQYQLVYLFGPKLNL